MNPFPSVPGSPSEVLAESECNDSAPFVKDDWYWSAVDAAVDLMKVEEWEKS